jgi:hypothetical protein
VAATPAQAVSAAQAVTVAEMPLTLVLMTARGLPLLLTRRLQPFALRAPAWEQLTSLPGFMILDESAGDYAAAGYVGQPWKLRSEGNPRVGPAQFEAFDEPGYAKAVMDFTARPEGTATRLRTETRIHVTDEDSRRAFGRYWRVVRAGSGLIRLEWLRAAKRRADRS